MKQVTVTMLCSLSFDIEEGASVEDRTKGIVEMINSMLNNAEIDSKTKITPTESILTSNIPNVQSIWSDIKPSFIGEQMIYVVGYQDAYVNAGEEKCLIAKINKETGEIIYKDKRARTDAYAQRMFNEIYKEYNQ